MKKSLMLDRAQKKLLCSLLESCVPRATVVAFGSRVYDESGEPRCHEGSDLDLAVQFTDSIARQDQIIALREALRESSLPFLVDVHDWSALPDPFHEKIRQNSYVLQASLAGAPDAPSSPGTSR